MSRRRYFRVGPSFWSDPSIVRLSDDAKLLALYVLTSPHRTTEGLFRMPKAYAMADLGWSEERFGEPFAELLREGFIEYDETVSVCLIVNALKWQAPENGNQAKAAAKAVSELPDTPLKTRFLSQVQRFSERLAQALPEGFGERLAEPIGNPPSPSPSPITTMSGKPDLALVEDDQKRQQREQQRRDEQAVFDAWVQACGKTSRVVFDDKRRRLIRRALAQFPLEDVLDAVRGWRRDPFYRGENDRGRAFNDLGLLLRDSEHVERFRDLERGHTRPARNLDRLGGTA